MSVQERVRLARIYGLAIGLGLLLEGGALLLLIASPSVLPLPFATGDVFHNSVHVAWGALLLLLLMTDGGARRTTPVVFAFGVFYTALGVLGVLIENPFGLVLGPAENAFHLVVGPLALGLSLWTAQTLSSTSAMNATRHNP